MIQLFVYGTLKRGGALNNVYLSESIFIKKATIKGVMYTNGMYPILFLGSEDIIKGEIWNVPTAEYEIVRVMEHRAGYRVTAIITIEGSKVSVFHQSVKCKPFYKHHNSITDFDIKTIGVFE